MRVPLQFILCICAIGAGATVHADDRSVAELQSLRAEITSLRQEYTARIRELEQRVAAAEQRTDTVAKPGGDSAPPVAAAAVVPLPAAGISAANNVFNPAIGVVFQGQAWDYGRDPAGYRIPGFPLGGEAGPVPAGLGLGETELDFNANVDDKFTAWLTVPIVIEDGAAGIEVEEAWIETTALPGGFAARLGRFFSGIGYQNNRHAHAWDFLDQPLPYQAFLGKQYLDDGLQLRWLAPIDLFLEFGGELLRGGRYPAGGAVDSGFGARSLYMKFGGDIDDNSSWLAGISYLHAKSADRGSGAGDAPLLFNGDTNLAIAQFVWKWSPHGNWQNKNLSVQGEYLWRNEDGRYTLPGAITLPYDQSQDGWYVQAVYQPFPRWRLGARYDTLAAGNPDGAYAGTELASAGADPRRYSLMLDWSNSEFSRLRFQYTYDDAGLAADNQWGIQYIYSIGAHGAHTF